MPRSPQFRWLGERRDYRATWAAMRRYTAKRSTESPDAFWALTHPPVFTQGLAGRPEHLLSPGHIPVIPTDRGGQVTYHGPGQLVLYTLVDLRRAGLGPRDWVHRLEQVVIDWLAARDVLAARRSDAPGVYVDHAKIAALGLKIRQGRCYHGLSFNIDMDLAPFARINPCGYQGLAVTDAKRLLGDTDALPTIAREFAADLGASLTP
ncbi:lipoyl(octanoyl) transferase LipB [Guyparkeria sp. SB14A]|uniref:lipoyl(octanoyl) transferase LipB n=1 Tax=Guyparkeria sp. SB14A TaxID=2571147 RepID=UPI0010ABEBB1|nr:lipoyl(octanoyl) transferase LipB [Guyparkeria sp. SB14A]TKA90061.1 lipoyl(octanoyl) transferase LipB [Guyparkeria sp. SB14A]